MVRGGRRQPPVNLITLLELSPLALGLVCLIWCLWDVLFTARDPRPHRRNPQNDDL